MTSGRKRMLGLVVALVLVASAVFVSRGGLHTTKLYTATGQAMGTTYMLKIVAGRSDRDKVTQAFQAADAAIQEVNTRMSTYRKDSELSQFNQMQSTEPFVFSAETFDVIERAQAISKESDGAFDITVGPLVNAWGFGPEKRPNHVLTDDELRPLRERVGYAMLTLDPAAKTVRKARPDIYCDLSAIAIGHSVDKAALVIEGLGFRRYMVDVGGEVRTLGLNADNRQWHIAIEKPTPEGRNIQKVIPLTGLAISTSGDYRNYYEENGVRLTHEIDPSTGRPISHTLASVSVISKECAFTDGHATAFMVMGPERTYDFAVKHDIAALLIIHDDNVPGGFVEKATPAFEALTKAGDAESQQTK